MERENVSRRRIRAGSAIVAVLLMAAPGGASLADAGAPGSPTGGGVAAALHGAVNSSAGGSTVAGASATRDGRSTSNSAKSSPRAAAPGSGDGTAPCAVGPDSWPMYQGAPSHSGNACSDINTTNVTTLHPAWFQRTGGVVTATPTVVNGTVLVGDSAGTFYALDQATGAPKWTFDITAGQSCYLDQPNPHSETHSVGNGEIASSAAVATIDKQSIVYFGGGGTLFALDAGSGKCLWAQDSDPAQPGSPTQVESSPVVDTSVKPPEVLVGNDDNSSSGITVTGLMAFNAVTGKLLWRYQPERDVTLTPGEFGGSDALTLACGSGLPSPADPHCTPANIPGLAPNDNSFADGCGDVWSSPALDPNFVDPAGSNSFQGSAKTPPAAWSPQQITESGKASDDGLITFGTGNCAADPTPAAALTHGDYVDNPGIFALDAVTGHRVWNFVAPYNDYDNNNQEPGAGDDDFGSSALLATVPSTSVPATACAPQDGATNLVIEGSKSGYAFGLCETNGNTIWSAFVSQPGQLSPDSVGSEGGFIGAPSLGMRGGRPTAFFTSSIPLPFSNDGIRFPNDGDTNISSCPGPVLSSLPLLPACPDTTILNDPARLFSLHAIDAATGQVDWHAVSLPSYGAASYTNGVVFDPMTTGFSETAYDAETGLPLWSFPLAAAPASGAAIVGNGIVIGAGVTDTFGVGGYLPSGVTLPPQLPGIWSFTTGSPGGTPAGSTPAGVRPQPLSTPIRRLP